MSASLCKTGGIFKVSNYKKYSSMTVKSATNYFMYGGISNSISNEVW